MDTKRIFIAISIKLSDDLLYILHDLKIELRNENINWVSLEKIHFTLKFFGETEINKFDGIIQVLNNVSQSITPFKLKIENTGVFNNFSNPKVIWLGLEQNKNLTNLYESINCQLEKIGYNKEQLDFKPHVTIGRIKSIKDKTKFKAIVNKISSNVYQEITINNIELFESLISFRGAIYKSIIKFVFKK